MASGIKETLANHRNGHTAYFPERNVPHVHPHCHKGQDFSLFFTAERNKPDTERQILYDLEVELREPERRMVVARGGREGAMGRC